MARHDGAGVPLSLDTGHSVCASLLSGHTVRFSHRAHLCCMQMRDWIHHPWMTHGLGEATDGGASKSPFASTVQENLAAALLHFSGQENKPAVKKKRTAERQRQLQKALCLYHSYPFV